MQAYEEVRSNAGMSMFVIQVVIFVAYVIMSQPVFKRLRAEKYMGQLL